MPGPDPWGLTNPEIQPVLDGDPNSKFRLNFPNFGHSGFCLFWGVWSIGPLDDGPAAEAKAQASQPEAREGVWSNGPLDHTPSGRSFLCAPARARSFKVRARALTLNFLLGFSSFRKGCGPMASGPIVGKFIENLLPAGCH